MEKLPIGKVPWSLLKIITHKIGFNENLGIVQNAEEGVDVAVLDIAEIIKQVNLLYKTNSIPYLIYKADPITFPTPNPAKYLVIINKNDLATAGALPYGLTSTILLPPGYSSKFLMDLQSKLSNVCEEHHITILGGHTEITDIISQPILSASMIGFVPPEYYIPRKPEIGDLIICSGWVGAEGTGILLDEGKIYFKEIFSDAEYNLGIKIGEDIDISTRVIGCNRKWHSSINLVHDATEGGIIGALYECLAPKGLGCTVDSSKIPIAGITNKISKILNINPLMLISSGAVLFICNKKHTHEIIEFLRNENKPAEIIGQITDKGSPLRINNSLITPPEADHLIQGLENLKILINRN